jgi:D-alanine-D-alanine ligase
MRIESELKRKKIGVLMGGMSSEREVSLRTGETVYQTLVDRGYNATKVFVDRDVDMVLRQTGIEVAYLALRGRFGEDGCIQGLLEILGIPYTGSGVIASALSLNKVKAKELFRLHNLPTPPYYVLGRPALDDLVEEHGSFGFPVVVKPVCEGSSIGVAIARNHEELRQAVENAFLFDDAVMVERHIRGVEVQVAVLDGQALGGIEVSSRGGLLDYQAKTLLGRTTCHFPARLSPPRYHGVLVQAQKAHQILGCKGLTLVDMIVSDLGNEYLLELNTLPSITQTSLVPRIAHGAGLDFGDLIESVLSSACLKARGDQTYQERDPYQHGFQSDEHLAPGAFTAN